MKHKWVYDDESFLDFLGLMIVHAPDFPEEDFLESEDQLNVEKAFDELRSGFQFVKFRLTEPEVAEAVSLMDASEQAFRIGDDRAGLRLLQDLDPLVVKKKA